MRRLVSVLTVILAAFLVAPVHAYQGRTPYVQGITIDPGTAALPAADTGTVGAFSNIDATTARVEGTSYAAASIFTGRRADGTRASPTALTTDDLIVAFNAHGFEGSSTWGSAAAGSLEIYAGGAWSTSSTPTYVSLSTTPSGSTTKAERLRVNSDGGITVPNSVTGGDQGTGTINASGLYVSGVSVSTWQTATLSADVTVSASTSQTNATGVSWSVAANTNYQFFCDLISNTVETGSSGGGLAIQFTGPASPTSIQYGSIFSYATTVAGGATAFSSVITPIPAGTLNTTVSALATHIAGALLNGANAGTVQLQFAEATGTASTSTTLKKGSFCNYKTF